MIWRRKTQLLRKFLTDVRMNQPWKVILAFAGVFVAGAICGGPLADWARKWHHQNRPPFAERTMRRFERELHLTPEQKEKIAPILRRAQTDWKQFRQENFRNLTGVLERMHVELSAELDATQRQKLEGISQELRARAEQFRGRPDVSPKGSPKAR
jgi:predicted amidophosphoribosyltransferase